MQNDHILLVSYPGFIQQMVHLSEEHVLFSIYIDKKGTWGAQA